MSLEYNTERTQLTLREYGRNVQNLVAHIKTVDDKEKRNKLAATLVELMKMINPEFSKDAQEYTQKVWDDLFIISKFDLDVESPFPIPEATILDRKPDRMTYQSNEIRYRHYGRNIEILINDAIAMEDPAEKEGAIIAIGKLMKSFYQTWNKDNIEDEQVLKNIKQLSKDQLTIDIEKVKTYGLFDSEKRYSDNNNNNRHQNRNRNNNNKGGKRNHSNNNKRRRNNN
ncbi:MAG: hypothetical protein CMB80_29085 [Flammeovirgaceae bacterium]|nr:hypothetical protein [Flammeovirgaceae bacterium]MBE63314.1 hypothetical protein [Flammeovirgaceae bacterium]HCX23545.1 DUF4290 domain-containing protein [Cytophagales bacterium]|tara:strand:- start:498 stop:1178 length:681 start_codon:yes stop_codon:yes gene_type:complete